MKTRQPNFFSILAAALCALYIDSTVTATDLLTKSVTDTPVNDLAATTLGDQGILCVWTPKEESGDGDAVHGALLAPSAAAWRSPRQLFRTSAHIDGLALHQKSENSVELLSVEDDHGKKTLLRSRVSDDSGATWSPPRTVLESLGRVYLAPSAALAGVVIVAEAAGEKVTIKALTLTSGGAWSSATIAASSTLASAAPIVFGNADSDLSVLLRRRDRPRRYLRSIRGDDGTWSVPAAVNLPFADADDHGSGGDHWSNESVHAALLPLDTTRAVAVSNDNVLRPSELSLRTSYDGGRTWPTRRILSTKAKSARPCLLRGNDEQVHVIYRGQGVQHLSFSASSATSHLQLASKPRLFNVTPPGNLGRRRRSAFSVSLPLADTPFMEHVQIPSNEREWQRVAPRPVARSVAGVAAAPTTPVVRQGNIEWVGTARGLYLRVADGAYELHPHYGVDGPLSNRIAGLAVDTNETLWVATPAGLSARSRQGAWNHVRGRDGLPWEELTSIAVDRDGHLWLGSSRGLIHYRPTADEGARRWFYRAGKRYLPDDNVLAVAVSEDGRSVFAHTQAGISRIDAVTRTLFSKAEYLERRINQRHRRLGIPAPANYSDETLTHWEHGPQPSDGLWTGYHVTAMCLAYSLTLDERYRTSARIGMEALYLLQNVTGIRGLVARSVVAVDEPAAARVRNQSNWHATKDGRYLWRDDVSSDQIDGHYLAFYAYFEHIAQFDPLERERLEKQIRQVTDYILENDYQIIDWNGKRTKWGWWSPPLLNDEPSNFLEAGLYSLMMLSFLKTAYYVTDDEKYLTHFRELIERHDYLSNLLLEKKVFPDMLNHSDDQLAAVAYYPILQLEHDPFIRDALQRAARRHAWIEVAERNSFMGLVYASIDPRGADVAGSVRTLREMPQDRRDWRMQNSHRADITFRPRRSRGGQPVLLEVLPYDEHHFERWNQDPYHADAGGNGRSEGAGVHYLLPYWIGRYHGLIAPPEA